MQNYNKKMRYANKREEIEEFLQKATYNAGLMNKGSRMTSGKTDIEKGMASPTNRHTGKAPRVVVATLRMGYVRIEAERAGELVESETRGRMVRT